MITAETLRNGSIRSLPKTDLHTHFLLSAPFETYQALAKGKIPPRPMTYGSLHKCFAYMGEFIIPLLHSPENIAIVVRDALRHQIEDGVVYMETSLNVSGPKRAGVGWSEYAAIVRNEIRKVEDKIEVAIDLGHPREQTEVWRDRMDEALDTGLFTGVDLYGDELHTAVTEYRDFFDAARARGLKIKLHTGEVGSGARMMEEIKLVKPDAIQHGIRAADDPAFMKVLMELGVPLHICPRSNIMLGLATSYLHHPISTLLRNGVQVTINTDDISCFGASVSDEYVSLFEHGALSAEELEIIRMNGLGMIVDGGDQKKGSQLCSRLPFTNMARN